MNTVLLSGQQIIPSKIICIGRNYVGHIAELGNQIPEEMVVFNKPNSAITNKLLAFHQETLHYEGEICFLYQNGQFSAVAFGLDLTKRKMQTALNLIPKQNFLSLDWLQNGKINQEILSTGMIVPIWEEP